MSAPIIAVAKRSEAKPFETQLDVQTAIMEYKVDHPDAAYSNRQYPDGFYIFAMGDDLKAVWLTR